MTVDNIYDGRLRLIEIPYAGQETTDKSLQKVNDIHPN